MPMGEDDRVKRHDGVFGGRVTVNTGVDGNSFGGKARTCSSNKVNEGLRRDDFARARREGGSRWWLFLFVLL